MVGRRHVSLGLEGAAIRAPRSPCLGSAAGLALREKPSMQNKTQWQQRAWLSINKHESSTTSCPSLPSPWLRGRCGVSEGDCFSRAAAQPLGSLSPGIGVGGHQHPCVFRHPGKLWQHAVPDGQPASAGAAIPSGLPAGSLRAALVSSAPQINAGAAGMPAEPARRRQPLQSATLAGAERWGALKRGSPCFPGASPRMPMVPGSPGPCGCGTLGGAWLHRRGSA